MSTDPAANDTGEDVASAAVLVVDDNPAKRLALRAMLAPLGHAVVEADCGRAALRAVTHQDFAVILMDVRMPTLDGFETARLIRERVECELTPVIFVTAFGADESESIAAYRSGAVDFIFTPVRAEVLQAKISAFVNLFLQTRELQRALSSTTALHAALRESEVRARAVLQNVADGIVTTGAEGIIESFNRAAQRLFGYDEQAIVGQPLEAIVAPSHHVDFSGPVRATWSLLTAQGFPAAPMVTVGLRRDGSTFPMEMDMSQMQIGERTFTIGCIRDISGRQAYTDALAHKTLHDDLTGLPNRTLFGDRLDQAIASADRADDSCGILVIDIDAFHAVNDTFGRAAGDLLLQAVAERLRGAVRASDTVARLRGDVFGILPAGETDVDTAAVVAWKIRAALEHPFAIDGDLIELRASIGIAFFPQHGLETPDLLRRADLAMREAKLSGSGLAIFATPPQQASRRLTQLTELRDGISRGELVLHFQPQIELGSTPRTIGLEALVRWRHPTEGLLMPAQFMPGAERSELIEPLTGWVLDEALRQQRAWRDAGLDLKMAVNISARSLAMGSQLPDIVGRLTDSWGIAPGMLTLELTESAVIDAAAPSVLDLLHTMGERLAIDDFGTGHSSLVYLQRLPIDEIKIDRSFVMNVATVAGDAIIVRSTIDLAHNLGMTVVAEGVEDQAALDLLVEYGCDSAQGYFFSRPYAADEMTAWLLQSAFGAQHHDHA